MAPSIVDQDARKSLVRDGPGFWVRTTDGVRANGGFAGFWERMTLLYKPGMVYLGQNRIFGVGTPMPVGMVGRGASLLRGASRSGKSAHFGTGGGSIVGKGAKFFCLDPNSQMRDILKSARWNVFVEFDRAVARDPQNDPDVVVRWADKVANALIVNDNGQSAAFCRQQSVI